MIRLWILAALFALAACASPATGDEAEGPAPGADGGLCGGIAGIACESEDHFCKMEPGACVDIADAAGLCTPKPEICTMEYDPVCGCDGETYGNACSAAAKGASVAYKGECQNAD